MRHIALYAIVLGLFLGQAVSAAPVILRSGEHGPFTRLVLYLDPDQKWQVSQSGLTTRIDLLGLTEDVDINGAFSRISRERLTDISLEDGAVLVATRCICAFESREAPLNRTTTLLILDFFDTPRPSTPTPDPQTALPPQTQAVAASSGQTGTSDRDDPPAVVLPYLFEPPFAAPVRAEAVLSQPTPVTEMAQPASTSRLLSQLERGAALGLIVQTPEMPSDAGELTPFETTSTSLHFKVTDSSAVPPRDVAAQPPALEECVLSGFLAPQNWGVPGRFVDGLELLRDDTTWQTAEAQNAKLASHYLRFGLTTEANTHLAELPPGREKTAYLMVIAAIDQGPAPAIASSHLFCAGPAALWGFLLEQDLARLKSAPAATILQSYLAFPNALRDVLRPSLTDQLRHAGFETQADAVQRQANRLLTDHDTNRPPEPLSNLLDGGSQPPTPDTLQETVQQAAHTTEDTASAELIDSYAFEYRHEKPAQVLQEAAILSLADAGDFREAFRRFAVLASDEPVPDIALPLFTALTTSANDHTFLQILSEQLEDGHPPPEQSVAAIRKRVQNMGFEELAARLPQAPPLDASPLPEATVLEKPTLATHNLKQTAPAADLAPLAHGRALVQGASDLRHKYWSLLDATAPEGSSP